jgi:polyvinyl alcohol dehydrogenase (cytochrome)
MGSRLVAGSRTLGRIALAVPLLLALLPVTGASAAGGCAPKHAGGDWRAMGHDLSNTRTQRAEKTIGTAEAASLAPKWVFSTVGNGGEGDINTTPTVAFGCVYTGSTGWVFALNADTGKLVWKRHVGTSSGFGGGMYAPSVTRKRVFISISGNKGPYAVALNRRTGKVVWKSAVYYSGPGAEADASMVLFRGMLFAAFVGQPENEPKVRGGFAIISAATGKILKVTYTIPKWAHKEGYGGASIWSTAVVDRRHGYAMVGAGNPFSQKEFRYANALLKIDMHRHRAKFGRIVDAYKGEKEQYPNPCTSDPCPQLDLDFGAAPNLFRDSHGRLILGTLQKSGVYHAVFADKMEANWSATVGGPCPTCNADPTAYDGKNIYGVGTPGGTMFALNKDDGSTVWTSPTADGVHYQGVSVANGVVYTLDSKGNLDTFDAATGQPLFSRPLSADAQDACVNLVSSGIAIARNMVYAPCGGYLIAYGV